MKDCDEALDTVFDDRVKDFSPELRGLLRQLWCEGVQRGLYLEREDLPVPPEVIEHMHRNVRPVPDADLSLEEKVQAPGRFTELERVKEALILLTEDLACTMESNINYAPTLALKGRELVKARHRYLSQVGQLHLRISELLERVRHFSVHSF
jgi:hypothetical protein